MHSNQNTIRYLMNEDTDNILDIYIDIINSKKDGDKAGVLITRFNSDKSLEAYIHNLVEQSNLAYLIKTRIL